MPTKPPLPDPEWGFAAPVGAIVEPPGGLRDAGWAPNDPHPAQFQNWLDNRYSRWVEWLRNSYPDAYQQYWPPTVGRGSGASVVATAGDMRVGWTNVNGHFWTTPVSIPEGYTINAYGCSNRLVAVVNMTIRLERWVDGLSNVSGVTFAAVPVGAPSITTVTSVEDPVNLPHVVTAGVYSIRVVMNTAATTNSFLNGVFLDIEPTS